MKARFLSTIPFVLLFLSLPACHPHKDEEGHSENHKVIATNPKLQDITLTQQYVCQIRSQRHINVRALQNGYLEAIPVKEGQAVKKGDLMFKVIPTLYQARLEAESAEADLALLEFNNTKKLFEDKVVSQNELALFQAKLAKAQAKKKLSEAELNFTSIRAPFDGIVDRLFEQQGSLVKEGDILTNLSDNTTMWVYFNVPEARYLELKTHQSQSQGAQLKLADSRIELQLADGGIFNQSGGDTVTIEGKFDSETGNIAFRADFPNPEGLLRHGQTGNILIHRRLKDVLVIPQRATFEILDKRYVFVVGEDNRVHQRLITILHEMDDIFVIKSGLTDKEKIILEGVRQVHDGEKPEYELIPSEVALANQKNHAE